MSLRDKKAGSRILSTSTWKCRVQLIVVLLCAAALKVHYSTASVNQLRWILAPTTLAVEFVSGSRFEFEAHAGYINADRTFLIAASCAGVNFLIAGFLMLALGKLWKHRSQNTTWKLIPSAAAFAYVATLVANTVRISTALRLQGTTLGTGWLTSNQLHRFEGIFIYFGFLCLMFTISEKLSPRTWIGLGSSAGDPAVLRSDTSRRLRQFLFPLLIYYATTLGIPLANGGYRQGIVFWEHLLFVLLTPLLLVLPLVTLRYFRDQWGRRKRQFAGDASNHLTAKSY